MEIDARSEAAKLFNETWDLIDIPAQERSAEQNAEMLHKAHASRYLWGLVGEPKQFATGEWQISHVYALLGFGAPALLHGQLSLDITLKSGLVGLEVSFAYEAVARAYAALGDTANAREYKNKGLEAAALIESADDRGYVEGELNNIVV